MFREQVLQVGAVPAAGSVAADYNPNAKQSCGAGRGEAGFEALLAASGFAVRHVPTAALHEEYRGGEYRVLRACLLGP